jgi:hypothetical protein
VRISAETLKREFEKFKKRVNIRGELIPIGRAGQLRVFPRQVVQSTY